MDCPTCVVFLQVFGSNGTVAIIRERILTYSSFVAKYEVYRSVPGAHHSMHDAPELLASLFS